MRWMHVMWLAACASPESPPGFGASRFSVDASEDSITVTLLPDPEAVEADPGFKMEFAGPGIRMPTSFRFPAAGMELLQAVDCPFEGGAGTGLFPIIRAVGGDVPAGNVSSHADVEINGLAIVRVKVDYDIPYTCSGVQVMHGESSFTFMPHGRIARHDTVTANTTALVDANATCGCGHGDGPYFFNSSWTFPPAGSRLDDETNQQIGDPPFPPHDAACAMFPGPGIGVGIQWAAAQQPVGGGIRIISDTPRNTIAFDYSNNAGAAQIPAMASGDVVSYVQLLPGGVECSALLDQVRETGHTLQVNGMQAHLDANGFYLEPTRFDSAVELTTPDSILAGFVVALDLGGRKHARVTGQGDGLDTSGAWFIPEVDPSTERALFWFKRALQPNQTITIEPMDE